MPFIDLKSPIIPRQRTEEEEKELSRLNAAASPRRIVLVAGESPHMYAEAESVLCEPQAKDLHAVLRQLAAKYPRSLMLAAEYLVDGKWRRFLWTWGKMA